MSADSLTLHAPAPQAAHTSRFYRPELDVLRFAAFLLVLMRHGVEVNRVGFLAHHPAIAAFVNQVQGAGSYGLSLFFFLSSFLITTLLLLERNKTGTISLPSFYIRRILRIWPLYFTFITAMFLLGQLWAPAHFSWQALAAFFLLSGNWYTILGATLPAPVMFLWSISVEEQFYLLWPALVRGLSIRGIHFFCTGLLAASSAAIYLLAAHGATVDAIWSNSLAESIFFAAGGLLALRMGLNQQKKSGPVAALCIALGAGCWLIAEGRPVADAGKLLVSGPITVASYLLVAAGCASMLFGFLHLPKVCIRPSLVYLGRISYGLYVFHGLVLFSFRQLLGRRLPHGGLWLVPAFALVVAAASLSYRFFEKPFLRLKYRFEMVHSRAA